jgi:hypothetical protein
MTRDMTVLDLAEPAPDDAVLDAVLAVLEEAREVTRLPERPGAEDAVHDLLVRLRTGR